MQVLPIGKLARIAIPFVAAAAMLTAGSTSALAAPVPSHAVGHKSVTVKFPADEIKKTLSGLKIARIGRPGTMVPFDDTPGCPDNWASGDLTVNWTWDTATGMTFASSAVWNEALTCVNMAYEQVATSLFINGSLAQNGSTPTCGTPTSTVNSCYYEGLVSTGTSNCTGGPGACALNYQMSAGVWIQLPAGWYWPGPAPVGCWDNASQTVMVCSFSTDPINVPVLNT